MNQHEFDALFAKLPNPFTRQDALQLLAAVDLGDLTPSQALRVARAETIVQSSAPRRAAEQTALYRFFDAAGGLLYVGISSDPILRTMQHRRSQPWWPAVSTMTAEMHGSRMAALMAEQQAITTEQPRHNRAGRSAVLEARP